jgi:predicted amidohydrolase
MIRKAIDGKAKLIVFPELSLTGYNIKDLNWDLAIDTRHPLPLRELLRLSEKITIVVGAIEEDERFAIYNSALVFEDGKLFSGHRKIYLPTYGMFEELRYFSPGKKVGAYSSKHGRIGILICEDAWHISLPYILAHDDSKVLLILAASPTRLSGKSSDLGNAQINSEHHRAYARLLSTYVVFANRVGNEDGVTFWGGSNVIDPSGQIIASAPLFEESLIFAEIDAREVQRARRASRHFIDDSPSLTVEQLLYNARNRENGY